LKGKCVVKIGGSVLKDRSSLVRIDSIARHFDEPVIVVSAFKGITDALYDLYECGECRLNGLKDLINMHLRMIKEEFSCSGDFQISQDSIKEKDSYVSYGEKISAYVIARFLTQNGLKSIPVYTDNSGIIVSDSGADLEIDIQTSSLFLRKIENMMDMKQIPIVTGFFGSDKFGKTRVLGRNSSDYSAVAVATILGIDRVVLVKDVPGIYLNITDRESLVRRIDYERALELCEAGARVVHPKALKLAKERNISLIITSGESIESGTVISD